MSDIRAALHAAIDDMDAVGWGEARTTDLRWEDVHAVIDATLAAADSLDAAWAEAEAAATDAGLVLSEVYRAELGCLGCQPDGTCPYGDWWAVADRDRHDDDPVRAEGPTPAAALRALAEQLRRA